MPMPIYIPPRKPILENATLEDRKRLYEEYKRELAACNPRYVHHDGAPKSLFQIFKGLFR